MLEVTDKAIAILDRSLDENKENESDVFRLTRSNGGFGLVLSEEHEDDQSIQCDDRAVLVMEPEISNALESAVLDAEDTPDGPRLTLRPPAGQ